MELLLLLLASYGLCFGLMNEKVPSVNRAFYALPLLRREEGNLFERMFACAYCTGFHTGWVVWVASRMIQVWEPVGFASGLVEMGLFAFASSAFCYMLDTSLRWLEG